MKTIRTFLAIELPKVVKAELQKEIDDLSRVTTESAVRWVSPENIHLTLRFLGDTPVDKLEFISKLVDGITSEFDKFELELGQLGCFPNPRNPRVIWVSIQGNQERLASLQKGIEEVVKPLGWEPEARPFHPHLTLGRVKDSRAVIQARYPWGSAAEKIPFRVEGVSLIESVLTPSGAIYTTRHYSPLRN